MKNEDKKKAAEIMVLEYRNNKNRILSKKYLKEIACERTSAEEYEVEQVIDDLKNNNILSENGFVPTSGFNSIPEELLRIKMRSEDAIKKIIEIYKI